MLWDPLRVDGMLLQFVLCGQGRMSQTEEAVSAESEQLSHRHAIVARLAPLNEEDTAQYVDHRLRVAGYGFEEPLFTPEAIGLIARYSEGLPRKINNLCYSALCLGYNLQRVRIDADVVREVAADLGLDRTSHRTIADLAQSPRLVAPPLLRVRPVRERGLFLRVVPKIGLAAAVLLAVAVSVVNVRRHGGQAHTVFSPLAVSSHAVPRPRVSTFRKVSDASGNGVGPGSPE